MRFGAVLLSAGALTLLHKSEAHGFLIQYSDSVRGRNESNEQPGDTTRQ
jgi:hypothetical protein